MTLGDPIELVSFRVLLTKDEIQLAIRTRIRLAYRRVVVLLVAIEVVIALITALLNNWSLFVLWSAFFVPFSIALVIFIELLVRRLAAKRFAAVEANGETNFTFSDGGWHAQNKFVSGDMKWEIVEKAEESDKFLFLGYRSSLVLLIPKRCLSDEQLAHMRSLIRAKLGAQARLQPNATPA